MSAERRRPRIGVLLALGMLPWTGCATTSSTGTSEERSVQATRAGVERFAKAYAAAFMSDDAEAVSALMTDDFAAVTSGKPPIVGRRAVHAAIVDDLSAMEVIDLEFTIVESEATGDSAWAWGSASGHVRLRHGPDTTPFSISGYFLWILERQGSEWRIRCDCAHEAEPSLH